jgi:hypothetical protein
MTSHVPPRLLAALYRAQDRVLAQPEPLEYAVGFMEYMETEEAKTND